MARMKRQGMSRASMSRQLAKQLANKSRQAQLKVRLPEALRFSLEREAASRGHSMNTEIVMRLRESFLARDEKTTLIAKTLLNGLDDSIVNEMVELVMQRRSIEEMDRLRREIQLGIEERQNKEDSK